VAIIGMAGVIGITIAAITAPKRRSFRSLRPSRGGGFHSKFAQPFPGLHGFI
jgi:hypothetical protein